MTGRKLYSNYSTLAPNRFIIVAQYFIIVVQLYMFAPIPQYGLMFY